MKKCPLISVIIPVYNGARFLGEAIESVLAQTYRPIEIVVVDDGSTDNTVKVAQQYHSQVHYISQKNLGAGAARNHGVREAKGEFLTFLDADDLWVKEKLEWQNSLFHKEQRPNLVFGHVKQFVSPELSEKMKNNIAIPSEIMRGFHIGTMMVKRHVFEEVGPFTEDLEVGEFIDWFARAQDAGCRMEMLPEVVMERRIHETNQGVYKRDMRSDYVRLLKSVLDRRRKATAS